MAAGADNLQDPFNPFGRGCPFETAALTVMTTHVLPHEAWEMVTDDARRAIGTAPTAIAPGQPADLLGVRADSIREAIAFAPPADRRIVIRRGRVLNRPG